MSEGDKDTDKGFLSRWSQRKREAKLQDADGAAAQTGDEAEASSAQAVEGSGAEEEIDLSSLPKLEDLTEATDITGFLRKGVPESLRNAALRKSWALDPAIRNYVNPALDYAYDWNTPGGVPGNSELAAGTDLAKMVMQVMGGDSAASDPQRAELGPQSEPNSDPDVAITEISDSAALQSRQSDLPLQPVRLSVQATIPPHETVDSQQSPHASVEQESQACAPQQPVRRHGTAKPKA